MEWYGIVNSFLICLSQIEFLIYVLDNKNRLLKAVCKILVNYYLTI